MDLMRIGVYGLITGVAGTAAGGFIALFLPEGNDKVIRFVLEYAAGLMLAVACFDLLPGAFAFAGLPVVLLGLILGVAAMIAAEALSRRAFGGSGLKETGTAIGIGVALHNLPEGLAIGSGFEASLTLGLSLALAILLHDIPEGLSIAVPLRSGGTGRLRALLMTALAGLPMGLGALIGAAAGQVSPVMISVCLSLASGAMLYVVLSDMLPQSHRLLVGRFSSLACILGFMTGLVSAHLLR